jgi:hypothetical protein
VRREDRVSEAGRGYPLIEGRIQAGIMRHVRTVDRSVSRSELTDALGVSRSKISLEVGRLLEAGLLVEDGLERVMNLLRNGLRMRKTGVQQGLELSE